MEIWGEIQELNEAQAALDKALGSQDYIQSWAYCGDVSIEQGGIATQVDRNGGYATVVECTDLASAIGQDGCVLIERGTVILTGGLSKRRHLRSALESFGWKASDLLQFDRPQRANELARALWVYGQRDYDLQMVIRWDGPEPEDGTGLDFMERGYMEVDSAVDGPDGLVTAFMRALD